MALLDLSGYQQPQTTTSDGTKFDNMLSAIQTVVNGLDNANVAAAAGLGVTKIADPGTGKVIGSGGTAAAAVFPPGYTLAYVEFTTNVTANNVAEAAATSVVSAGAVTFDGTAVDIEFFAPAFAPGGSLTGGINLWDGTTDLGRWFDAVTVQLTTNVPGGPLKRRLTPSAGAHTYSARVWTTTVSNFNVLADVGGAGTKMPGYIKITKA